VLVKASHSIGLEAVALALTGERPFPPGAAGAADHADPADHPGHAQ
jgi:hypothetical protein